MVVWNTVILRPLIKVALRSHTHGGVGSFRVFFCKKFGQLVLGLASGLEAFSREPPCDSIGALAVRQTPKTSGMAWEFLSYYPKLPSRCLRDPLCYLLCVCFLKEEETFYGSNLPTKNPDLITKSPNPGETQAQSPHYCFAQFLFSQFPAK